MKNKKNKDLIFINFFSNDLPFFLQFEFLIYIIFLLTEEFLLTYLVKEMRRFLNLFRFRRVSEEFHLTYVVKQVCQCINSISVWLSEEFFIFAPLWRILLLNTEFSAGSIFSFNALIFTHLPLTCAVSDEIHGDFYLCSCRVDVPPSLVYFKIFP